MTLQRTFRPWAAATAALFFAVAGCHQNPAPPPSTAQTPLPTGKFINPQSLASQNVGSLPINLIASADGQYAISTDEGYRQSLWSTRISDGQGVSHVAFNQKKGKTATTQEKTNGLYYGLAAGDGVIYAAQGGHDTIAVLSIDPAGVMNKERSIAAKKGDFPAGLALDANNRLYVANNDPVAPPPDFKPSSVTIYDAKLGKEIGRYNFADSFGGTPNFPLAIAVTKDGKKCYVASQRDSAVYVLDTTDPTHIKQLTKIESGSHPVALLFSKAQSTLFIANAQSDTISFVDTATDTVKETILLRPDIARSVAGATPTSLALSPTEKFLYATLGDMNAVAVIDVPDKELDGYIATGWYPSSVIVSPDGQRLIVANAKGVKPRNPNPPSGDPKKKTSPNNLLEGTVMSLAIPTKEDLKKQTEQVLEYNRLTPRFLAADNPLKDIGLQSGKITHVIYIIKENRTYDHVLGDMKQGNGAANYCLFPREVTPNLHALAERFVLLDNFYDSGEVSGDGWTWSTQAMANEYTIRNVPYQYSDRGRHFDYEGTNNSWLTGGFPAIGPDGKPLSDLPAFKNGAKAFPDVAEAPGGHLWDAAKKAGLTYRNYGMFMSNGIKTKDGKQVIPDNYPAAAGLQPGGHNLDGMTDVDFRKFDLDYPDSDGPSMYFEKTKDKNFLWGKTKFGKFDAKSRFTEWRREFQQMLDKDPSGNAVPTLMLVRLGTDHTQGANPGKKSPKAMVADNDYAVGQLVETISHSPLWPHTAIFILEDDAQDGPDHLDAHRSTCYVISPYMKKNSIDHAFYNTSACIRTMELLLGLPPMCQYDAIATPIGNWDMTPNNTEPYTAILPPANIMVQVNPKANEVKPVSPEAALLNDALKMDFTVADRVPADQLNDMLWKMSKGYDSKMPPTPKGIAGVTVPKTKDDDDD